MKIINYLSIAISILIISCGPTPPKTENRPEITTEIISSNEDGKSIASLSIKGMSCEMNCVSKVNKTLTSIQGVKDIDIDFLAEREIDIATVEFDPNQTSTEAMVKAIQELYDGQYMVTKVHLQESDKQN